MNRMHRRLEQLKKQHPLRYRNVIEAVKACACVFHATLTATFLGDPDPGSVVMSDEEAMAAAERFFDAIMSALDENALQAITHDEVFDERYLAKTGSLGHRVYRCFADPTTPVWLFDSKRGNRAERQQGRLELLWREAECKSDRSRHSRQAPALLAPDLRSQPHALFRLKRSMTAALSSARPRLSWPRPSFAASARAWDT